MKKFKFAFLLVALFFTISASANLKPEELNIHSPFSGEKLLSPEAKSVDFNIQLIWIYTTCPNGQIRAVGVIGLNDQGEFIDYLYWGEAEACKNDQVLIFV